MPRTQRNQDPVWITSPPLGGGGGGAANHSTLLTRLELELQRQQQAALRYLTDNFLAFILFYFFNPLARLPTNSLLPLDILLSILPNHLGKAQPSFALPV